jgi:sugar lactone lactonase YvrE
VDRHIQGEGVLLGRALRIMISTALAVVLLLCAFSASAQQYVVSTIAGGGLPPTPAPAINSAVGRVQSIAADNAGNVYFANFNCIFKIDGSGMLTRLAGNGRAGYSGDGGPAVSAQLVPFAVAVDSAGNVFVSDTTNNVVRKISTNGAISTFAGGGSGGDGSLAAMAATPQPTSLAIDSIGNVYIGEAAQVVRKVDTSGIITTVAGGGSAVPGDGGSATGAMLGSISGIAVDSNDNLLIAASGRVRRVSSGGTISTVAGTGTVVGGAISGDGGLALNASLGSLWDVAADRAGNIYLNDPPEIRKITPDGNINIVSGVTYGAVAADTAGNLYVGDAVLLQIAKVTNGVVKTVAGNGLEAYFGDGGPATSGQLLQPYGLALDAAGNLYIADTGDQRVRKVSPAGIITTLAGNGYQGNYGDGSAAVNAALEQPEGVTVDSGGDVYITDSAYSRIRVVTPDGNINLVAGSYPGFSGDGGPAANAQLSFATGLLVDPSGSLYVSDTGNGRVRMISKSTGIITTVAGGGSASPGDGGLATNAALVAPQGIARDSAGNLYIADTRDCRIRKVDTGGIITTIAGSGSLALSAVADGASAVSGSICPGGIALDQAGRLFFQEGARIRLLLANGTVKTVAGSTSSGYTGDGGLATQALFGLGFSLVVSSTGNVYASDVSNNNVRLLQLIPLAVSTSGLPPALTTQPYSQTLAASGGFPPYTWSISSGSLPSGLTLSSGRISGTPNAAGTSTLSVTVLDSSSPPFSASATLTITVRNPAPTINSLASTSAIAGSAAFSLTINGGGFTSTSQALWNGSPRATTVFNGSTLTIGITTADLSAPGTSAITVANPSPGGGASYAASFLVTPVCQPAASWSLPSPIGGAAYAGTVSVTAPLGCSWTAVSKANFLTITSGGTGTGPGSVTFQVAPNPGAARTGSLTVAGTTVTINQSALATVGKQYTITTIAGVSAPSTIPAPALTVSISPRRMTLDAAGNLYIAASSPNFVFKMDTTGMLASLGTTATLGVAVDPAGNVCIVSGNVVLSRAANGSQVVLAGGGNASPGDGGQATAAKLGTLADIAFDGAGNLYIAETGNNRIRKVSPAGVISTLSSVTNLGAMAVDNAGNVYFAQGNQVSRISVDGSLSVVAGTGVYGYTGDGGPATSAAIFSPSALALDGAGSLYVADTFGEIRKVSTSGIISRFAGAGGAGFYGDGGPALSAQLANVSGMVADSSGNLYVADTNRIRQITPGGVITTVAGNGIQFGAGDGGPALNAELNQPAGLALDSSGSLYIADGFNNLVRKISNGTITTIAGRSFAYPYPTGDGGPATSAFLQQPTGVALDPSGVYIADGSNAEIRKVSASTGSITTVAGSGGGAVPSGDGGPATSAKMSYVGGVAVSPNGSIYISDYFNNRIRQVSPSGIMTTLAGIGAGQLAHDSGFSGDGGPAASAKLAAPTSVAVDATGNVYFADTGNHRVRKVTTDGIITTVAGGGSASPGDGGLATAASLYPLSIALDSQGNLYVGETNRIHLVSPAGIITTIAGTGTNGYTGDGGPATNAQLSTPGGLAVDSAGNVYVADTSNGVIRLLTPQQLAVATTPSLPAASIGAAYSQSLAGSGGTLPYSWSLASGTLPAGLTLSSTGTVSGTPKASGRFTFTVMASDGVSSTASSTVTLTVGYLVGDVFPSTGDSAGAFGDGTLNTLDLVEMLRVVVGLETVPAKCSDRFDAIDAFPTDTATTVGGDGTLNTLDLITVLKRVVNLDTTRPARAPRTSCVSAFAFSQPNALPETAGTLEMVAAGSAADGWQRTAVYLRTVGSVDLAGLSLSLSSESGGTLRFTPSQDQAPTITDTGIPGKLGIAWLNGWRTRAGGRILLGYAETLAGAASLAFVAASANASDGHDVTFGLGPPRRMPR